MKPLIAFSFLAALRLLHGASPPAADTFRGAGVTVQLVSEVRAIHPGQTFYAGLFLHHDAGHHTYWKNPGLAGVATKLDWSLPEGFSADVIEWPAPEKVKMATINTHGYERDVLLMVKITPPEKISAASITLKTKASWMCCGSTCNPGYCDLSLTLPVAPGKDPAWHEKWRPVFEKERIRFPVPMTGWKLTAWREGDHLILTGQPEKGAAMPLAPVFFSGDNLICSHQPQIWEKEGAGFRARLRVSDLPPKEESVLRGLLAGKPGWIPKIPRSVSIEVPLDRSKGDSSAPHSR